MQSIKLHWYQTANFGDALSPILVRNLSGREVTYAHPRTADIVGVGSVLFAGSSLFIERTQLFSLFGIGKIMLKAMDAFRQRLNVWGSGFLCNPDVSDVIRIRKVHLCATRGRKSLDVFERAGFISKAETSFVALGDPGLLYYTLLDETPKKEYDLGIVPHYLDAQSGHALGVAFEKIGVQVKVIDVMQSNPLNVIREIASCERILSSSLHGLIVADSLHIPNKHIVFSSLGQTIDEYTFKFEDYYSAFGEKNDSVIDCRNSATPVDVLKELPRTPRFSFEQILELQEGLLAAFPFKK